MNLKPQDLLFLLKLVALGKEDWSFAKLAIALGMSPSEVHAAAKRALVARLAGKEDDHIRPNIMNLEEFLLHGIQYVFVPDRGGLNRGMPTAYAYGPLEDYFTGSKGELPPVWPDPDGRIKGESFAPLYKSAPTAAKNDPKLYELLALVDVLRGGRARERDIAKNELKSRLSSYHGLEDSMQSSDKDNIAIGKTFVVPRRNLEKLAQRYHIKRLSLFGSAARGELGPDSDIDLIAEFEKGKSPSLGGMVKIHDDFSTLFKGRKVDIATPSIMNNPYRRQAIEREIEKLYAA
ncbi:MAG: hypothetical protein GXP09_00525 [Gammaproteobacteria bacterium]|nr:hypothetical protein [Gammaproteobacteria bacterium]